MTDKDIKEMIEFTTGEEQTKEKDVLMTKERLYEMYVAALDDGGRALINVDLSLNALAPVPSYHWLLGIQVELQMPDEQWFYADEEKEALMAVEKRAVQVLEEEGHARFVGSVTYAGNHMIYFYGKDENYLPPLVGKIAAEFKEYDINFMSENDGPWSFYYTALYPSDVDLMHIRNRHMLKNLAEAGVDLNATYAVSYFFYFQDGASRGQAAAKFRILGYEIVDDHIYDDALDPMSMGLRIMAHHDLRYETITEKTYECFEVMEEYIGIFDGWELSPAEDLGAEDWI